MVKSNMNIMFSPAIRGCSESDSQKVVEKVGTMPRAWDVRRHDDAPKSAPNLTSSSSLFLQEQRVRRTVRRQMWVASDATHNSLHTMPSNVDILPETGD
jgi:hypothetical protein